MRGIEEKEEGREKEEEISEVERANIVYKICNQPSSLTASVHPSNVPLLVYTYVEVKYIS